MAIDAVKFFNIDELFCISNSILLTEEYLNRDADAYRKRIGVSPEFAESLRAAASNELRSRPNYLDDSPAWIKTAEPSDMSMDAIGWLSVEELVCFANCIEIALEFMDEEGLFDTRVSVTMHFARSMIAALREELETRPGP